MKKILISATFILFSLYTIAQTSMLGEIRVFAGNFPPRDWAVCDGQILPVAQFPALYSLLGNTYGGVAGSTFALPDLRAKAPIGTDLGSGANYPLGQTGGSSTISFNAVNIPAHIHSVTLQNSQDAGNADNPAGNVPATTSGNTYSASSDGSYMANNSLSINLSNTGSGQAQNNIQPYLGINYIIALTGAYLETTNYPYIGEIRMVAFDSQRLTNYAPDAWASCDGRTLQIDQNSTLYSLLGTTFGGDGNTTFQLPDLRGRVPVSQGQIPASAINYVRGALGGEDGQAITPGMMAVHKHIATSTMQVFSGIGDSNTPVDNYPAINPQRGNEFSSTSNTTTPSTSIYSGVYGYGTPVPVDNRQPYCTIQYVISLQGIYPPTQ
jgi:microcystin-dependent protein